MRRIGVFAAALLLTAACQREAPVATVNGKPIPQRAYESQVSAELERHRRQRGKSRPGMDERIRETVLRRMVEEEVVAQKAQALGIGDDAALERAAFDAMRKARFADAAAFREYLERTGHDEASFREEHRRNSRRERVLDEMVRRGAGDRAAALQALLAEARVDNGRK